MFLKPVLLLRGRIYYHDDDYNNVGFKPHSGGIGGWNYNTSNTRSDGSVNAGEIRPQQPILELIHMKNQA